MKNKIVLAVAFLSIASGVSLQAGEETAWQRKSVDSVKQELAKTDESSFTSRLSAYSYEQY